MNENRVSDIVNKKEVTHQWQTLKANRLERNEFMYCNELISDIKFYIGKTKQILIPAHKYVLGTSSPVFFAMCCSEFRKDDIININDCDPEPFLELLRFIYYDQVHLTKTNALDVLYLADKYIIPFLSKECVNFLLDNVTTENVLEVLSASLCLNEKRLEKHCWSILSRKTKEILQSDSFLDIDHMLLIKILKKDCLDVLEVDVFEAVKKWVERECFRNSLELTTSNKRVLLTDILPLIRFPVMSAKEFALSPAQSDLLSLEDIKNIFIFLTSGVGGSSLTYPLNPRQFKPHICSRYIKPMKNYLWRYDEKDVDAIRFQVDQEILLAGVGLFGSPSGGEYFAEMTVSIGEEEIYKSKSNFVSPPDPEFNNNGNPKIHEVMFDEPIHLKAGTYYDISVLLDGPPSFAGDDGKQEVIEEGVNFIFENSTGSTNGTSFDEGQIPSLLFYF